MLTRYIDDSEGAPITAQVLGSQNFYYGIKIPFEEFRATDTKNPMKTLNLIIFLMISLMDEIFTVGGFSVNRKYKAIIPSTYHGTQKLEPVSECC